MDTRTSVVELDAVEIQQLISQLLQLKEQLQSSLDNVRDFPDSHLWEGGLQAASRISRSSAWVELDRLSAAEEDSVKLEFLRSFHESFSRLIPEIFSVGTRLRFACEGKYTSANLQAIQELELTAAHIGAGVYQLLSIFYSCPKG